MNEERSEAMLGLVYDGIIRSLKRGKIIENEIDLLNLRHLVVGAYWLGLYVSGETDMKDLITFSKPVRRKK